MWLNSNKRSGTLVVVYRIGVLALQGGFAKHEEKLRKLGHTTQQVRYAADLCGCQGLIIPGGESTIMLQQIDERKLYQPLEQFATQSPIFGTCAGMIVMARMGILNIVVERNAFGRQISSFSSPLCVSISAQPIEALFIRAPRISAFLSKKIAVLGNLEKEPVLIEQGIHMAASFHPELTEDLTVHIYFTSLIRKTHYGS